MKTAKMFATVLPNGMIALLCYDATPPHELKPDQIELTEKEYNLLKALPQHNSGASVMEGIEILRALQDKIVEVLVK